MKNKIKFWLWKFLGLNKIICEIDNLQKRCKFLESLVDVGVDINQRSRSWAVVCLRGKVEKVNFYESDDNTIEEITRFLLQFKRDNLIIDAHPQCRFIMNDILQRR